MTANSAGKGGSGKSRRRARRMPKRLRRTARWAALTALWGTIAIVAILGVFALDLPDIGDLNDTARRPGITLLAADETRIASFGDLYGEWLTVDELPPVLIDAVLATEDRRFYDHFGIDLHGLARALWANIRAGHVVQGGSTITQQLAKNLFLTPERTIKRKIQEVLLALWMEQLFTKDQILTLYLNRVYLGAGNYGVDAAARHYFGHSARSLSVAEAAMLAGLLKAPSRYAPTNDVERARARAAQVIRNLVDAGRLDQAGADAALAAMPRLKPPKAPSSARYFADWVATQLPGLIGNTGRDLVIRTTLAPRLQRLAERAVAANLARDGDRLNAHQAALVALAPGGAVRAMVGGRSYATSQFNRATQALRQPGSAFKLFVYLAAMEAGLTPESRMRDSPVILEGWRPQNYSKRYRGEVTLRQALIHSINTVAVKLSERVNRRRVIAAARRLGITSKMTARPSLALGTSEVRLIELTAAYGTLAHNGRPVRPYGIVEIRDGAGTVLYRRPERRDEPVIDPLVLGELNDMLIDVLKTGTGKAAYLDRPAAGKTGTSQDFRDALFIGYTADLVAGVWVGNDDGTPMRKVTGGGLPARIWRDFMAPAVADMPVRDLPRYQPVPEQKKKKKRGFFSRLFSRK